MTYTLHYFQVVVVSLAHDYLCASAREQLNHNDGVPHASL